MPKPMPELLPCPKCPDMVPNIYKHPMMNWRVQIILSRGFWSIETGFYQTERGARNAWNRLMLGMGAQQ